MSLPIAWIEKIFARMAMGYGRRFLAQWDGQDLGPVKQMWAEELAGFQDMPEAISYALAHLPSDEPPTVFKFREICRRAPRKELMKISNDPTVTEEQRQKVRDLLASLTLKKVPHA